MLTSALVTVAVFLAATGRAGAAGEAAAAPAFTVAVPGEKVGHGSTSVAMVIAPDGSLHAAFPRHGEGLVEDHFYVASHDGGATWSAAFRCGRGTQVLDTSKGASTDDRIAVDGKGRVYVFWHDLSSDFLPQDKVASNGYDLHARVLDGGKWGKPFVVGRHGDTHDYFVTTDPAGTVHVVWCEFAHVADPSGRELTVTTPSAIMTQTLDGPVAGPAKPVITPAVKVTRGGWGLQYDAYARINGYVDGAGLVHYVGEKVRLGRRGWRQWR